MRSRAVSAPSADASGASVHPHASPVSIRTYSCNIYTSTMIIERARFADCCAMRATRLWAYSQSVAIACVPPSRTLNSMQVTPGRHGEAAIVGRYIPCQESGGGSRRGVRRIRAHRRRDDEEAAQDAARIWLRSLPLARSRRRMWRGPGRRSRGSQRYVENES